MVIAVCSKVRERGRERERERGRERDKKREREEKSVHVRVHSVFRAPCPCPCSCPCSCLCPCSCQKTWTWTSRWTWTEKIQRREIFVVSFFHQTTSPSPVKHVLKGFRFFFLQEFRTCNPPVYSPPGSRDSGVFTTVESSIPSVFHSSESRLDSSLWNHDSVVYSSPGSLGSPVMNTSRSGPELIYKKNSW
jgi:hypothetical protein